MQIFNVRATAFDETDDLHLTAAARALQWVDFVHSLDQHRPSGNRAGTGAVGVRLLGIQRGTVEREFLRFGFVRLPLFRAGPPLPVRVPTKIANQVFALVGNVLRDFGQKVQGAEDLEVPFRSAAQIGAGRSGKAATVVLFRTIDHRSFAGQSHDARQAEWTAQDVLSQPPQPRCVTRWERDTVVDAETRERPGTHLVDRLLIDLAGRHEQFKYFVLPRGEQQSLVDFREAQERASGSERAVGGDGVDVRMKVDQFAKGLDAGNHARFYVAAPEHLLIDLHGGLPGGVGQFPQQIAIQAAEDT